MQATQDRKHGHLTPQQLQEKSVKSRLRLLTIGFLDSLPAMSVAVPSLLGMQDLKHAPEKRKQGKGRDCQAGC